MVSSDKKTLYVFGGAIWPSAPWLAVTALGYDDQVNVEQVNLVEGANFAPDFVRKNPAATLPTLLIPGEDNLTDTTSVIKYMIANAPKPAGKSSGTNFVAKIHEDAVDPNFALLSARNDQELAAKNGGIPGLFIRSRQAALLKYAPTAPDLKSFYDAKIAANGFLDLVYSAGVPEDVKQNWFAKSKAAWEAIRAFILNDIPAVLPESGYIGGENPGEDDFHLAAWLARIALLTGATPKEDGVLSLKNELGGAEVPEKIVNYWKLWSATPAWAIVYKDGLH
ncbi:hypothetical protein FRC00_005831 [Tulasnella sp. 408]|nr:hypothetical protein FRC00_005831 [Tulasnella sp. 408]